MTKTSIILMMPKIVYIQSHAYIFNSSTLFKNVPMAQWSTLMPCNQEAAGLNLWGFGFFLKGAHYEVDYSGKQTYLAGLQCTLTSSCAKNMLRTFSWKTHQKVSKHQRQPFMFGKRFRSLNLTCWATWERFFWTSASSVLKHNSLRK